MVRSLSFGLIRFGNKKKRNVDEFSQRCALYLSAVFRIPQTGGKSQLRHECCMRNHCIMLATKPLTGHLSDSGAGGSAIRSKHLSVYEDCKMNKLYVLECAKVIHVCWDEPPAEHGIAWKWNGNKYYHPDTEIYIAKSSAVGRTNQPSVANAIMQALQGANMAVSRLQRLENSPAKRKKKNTPGVIQLLLFPED